MPIVPYVGTETVLWIAEQATFGTAIADDAADSWHEIQSVGGKIAPDVNIIDVKGDRGYRYPDVEDFHHTEDGAMPAAIISDIPIRKTDLARFWMLFFHNCTEGEEAPFSKTFTIPTTYPDFSANGGLFCSVIHKMPVAASSWKINDCICQHLNLKNSPKSVVTGSVDLVGRGATSTTADPDATQLLAPATFFTWERMARFTYAVGGGNLSPVPYAWDLDLRWKITPAGADGSGLFQTFILDEFAGTFKATLLWDANTKLLFSKLADKTAVEFNVGYGNASAGTVDGDFDISGHGLLNAASIERGDTLNKEITINLVGDEENSKVPITIIVADGEDKAY